MSKASRRTAEPAVTLATIAAAAGVSTPTVSKVLNGRADVAPATRAKVERVIDEQGYRRSAAAARSRVLELTFHEFYGPFAIEILSGVEEIARANRLGIVVSALQGRLEADEVWLEDVLRRTPLGVIAVFSHVSTPQLAELHARGIPVVLVDPTGEPSHATPSVGATDWHGGLAATRHLIELGHQRIGMITGPDHIPCSRARLHGYRTALDEAGIAADPALFCWGNFGFDDGRDLAARLLQLPNPPTAIFTGNDLQALGVYNAARQCGLRVPDDLSVVGFDDVSVAAWSNPPLTTVRQPLAKMAAEAARMLVDLTQDRPVPDRVELATSLVVRDSTAPPRVSAKRRRRAAG